MSRLETLLSKTDKIPELLDVIDVIYYTGKPQVFDGVEYTFEDLPGDEKYDMYREKYTPDIRPGTNLTGSVPPEERIDHKYVMGSLPKVKDIVYDKLDKIFEKYHNEDMIVMEKIDGASTQATFIDGRLKSATTRFEREVGRNITDQAARYITRPDPTVSSGELIINGESIWPGDGYVRAGNANRRAATSGLLNRKDFSALDKLQFIAYEIPNDDERSLLEKLEFLSKAGFKIPRYEVVPFEKMTKRYLLDIYGKWKGENSQDKKYGYDIDGLVIAPASYLFENVEVPKLKIAFKIQGVGEWTTVKAINVRAERTGLVIPHILVETVLVDQTEISAVSGATFNKLSEKDIRVGSRVYVIRANDVTPYILEVDNSELDESTKFAVPTHCPSCNTPLEQTGLQLKCPNVSCPEKLTRTYILFFKIMGLETFGPTLLEPLNLTGFEDAYDLSVQQLEKMPKWGHIRAERFYNNIRKIIEEVNEATLLAAMGIPGIQLKIAKNILANMSIEHLFGIDITTGKRIEGWLFPTDELMQISGLGKKTVEKLTNYAMRGQEILQFLVQRGSSITKTAKPTAIVDENFNSRRFVLTGKGTYSRNEYKEKIQAKGGSVTGTISGQTDFLVTDGATKSGAKIDAAKEKGVPIMLYKKLDEWLNGI